MNQTRNHLPLLPDSSPIARRGSRAGHLPWALMACLTLLGSACKKETRPEEPKVPKGPEESLRKKIEKLTGGPTKIVWLRDTGNGKDTFANGTDLVLMGLDTREAAGEMVLSKEKANYSRPLITPDGEAIVFSRRTARKEKGIVKWDSEIFTVDWKSGQPKSLRSGYALDVWQQPDTGTAWVYALTTMRDGIGANPEGTRMFRFPLTDPGQPGEVVWEHGLISGDNIQVNRAGTSASGLIPWPNAGTFDFASGRFVRFRNGCWPSLAPDNSGLIWVFDGTHKNLRMFLPGVEGNWRVSLGKADGVKDKAVYHPRWSNHPHIIGMTGPHPVVPTKGSGKVSVILGRFNDSLTSVSSSVSLRNSSGEPDCYPDVWVAGGGSVSLDPSRIGPKRIQELAANPPPRVETWEAPEEGLRFVWERANSSNAIKGYEEACSVQAGGFARFGPRYDMLVDGGGTFVVDPLSAAAIRAAVQSGTWSMELAVTPLTVNNPMAQVIFRAGPDLELQQFQHDFILHTAGKFWQIGAGLTSGQTTHLVVGNSKEGKSPEVWLNGVSQVMRPWPGAPALPVADSPEVQFGARADGSAAWSGRLETIAVHSRQPDSATVMAHAAWWKKQLTAYEVPARTVVRARLKEASPRATPDDIGPYTRSWTSAVYEKTALVSGPDPGTEFSVAHWTILGAQPVDGLPAAPGTESELTLEPMAAHPEMESEHGSEEILPIENPLPQFLDVAPPGA